MLTAPAVAAALAGTAGCTGTLSEMSTSLSTADLTAGAAAARAERELLTTYDAAIARHPGIAGLLSALRAHHEEHIRALTARLPHLASAEPTAPGAAAAAAGPTAGPTPAGSASADPSQTGPAVDDTVSARATTLTELAVAEQEAAAGHRAGCLAATTALAPLLASLYAAETCHVDLLGLVAAAPGAGA